MVILDSYDEVIVLVLAEKFRLPEEISMAYRTYLINYYLGLKRKIGIALKRSL